MKFSSIFKLPGIACLVITSSLCLADVQFPDTTVDGLQRVRDSDLAVVYVLPGVEFGQYSKVMLEETRVAFKKRWKHDKDKKITAGISAGDMAKIKAELALLFSEVFSQTLEQSGYQLVTDRADDVLLVRPAIINLDIITTDTAPATHSYTYAESVGEMTLYLELYDSVTGDIIATALDRKIERKTGYIGWQNRVSNRAAARRIMQVWANVLTEGLNEAGGPLREDSTSIPLDDVIR